MLSFLWATFETAMRGFLLGFGAMICKEVLTGKEVLTFSKARVAGLGVGCLVVGASILLPAGVRHKMMALL